jgi:hypothetical protein
VRKCKYSKRFELQRFSGLLFAIIHRSHSPEGKPYVPLRINDDRHVRVPDRQIFLRVFYGHSSLFHVGAWPEDADISVGGGVGGGGAIETEFQILNTLLAEKVAQLAVTEISCSRFFAGGTPCFSKALSSQ